MYFAIENMDYELYKRTEFYEGVLPSFNQTFRLIEDFIYDMKNTRRSWTDNWGWDMVDYELLNTLTNHYREQLKLYWPRYSELYMNYALLQESKKGVQWLLNNVSYTKEELERMSQEPWVKPEFKEMLKPKSFIGGALSVLTGGFFF